MNEIISIMYPQILILLSMKGEDVKSYLLFSDQKDKVIASSYLLSSAQLSSNV